MSTTDRNTLKGWFVKGAKPLAAQFSAWIDSYWHKDDAIPAANIDGLQASLDAATTTAAAAATLAASAAEKAETASSASKVVKALFVEKIGVNSLIYPKYFRYNSDLSITAVVLAGNASGATFTVGGTAYTQTTLVGVSLPSGTDLIISDIDIAAGHDTGSVTIIF